MGIIIKQSFKGTLYSYIGAAIGFVNVGLLMPLILSSSEIGLINLLVAISVIFGQFGTLGFQSVIVRMFPFFKNDEGNNGFLGLSLFIGLIGFAICLFLFFILKDYIIASNIQKSPLFVDKLYFLIPLIFVSLYYVLLDSFSRAILNATIGVFLKEFLVRLLNLVGLGLFYFNLIDFNGFLLFYVLAYSLPCLGLIIYLYSVNQLSFKLPHRFMSPELKKEVSLVALYGLIASFSGIAVVSIDKYMVNYFCGLSDTGIYSTMFLFGSFIVIAGRSVTRISAPLLAQAFKDKADNTVRDIYFKSVTNQMFIALLLFLGIWSNIHNIFRILPPEYEAGKWVVFFIGISQILTMSTGVSNEVIRNSGKYKVFTYIMMMFICLIVVSNAIFIPKYGIVGAAMASTLSYVIYSIVRLVYIERHFKLFPYTYKHLMMYILAGASLFITQQIPIMDNLIFDIFIRSVVITVLFFFSTLFLKLSPEVNLIFNRMLVILKLKH